jgi:hypothetical protein
LGAAVILPAIVGSLFIPTTWGVALSLDLLSKAVGFADLVGLRRLAPAYLFDASTILFLFSCSSV